MTSMRGPVMSARPGHDKLVGIRLDELLESVISARVDLNEPDVVARLDRDRRLTLWIEQSDGAATDYLPSPRTVDRVNAGLLLRNPDRPGRYARPWRRQPRRRDSRGQPTQVRETGVEPH